MNTIYEEALKLCETEFDELKSAIRRIIELGYLGNREGLFSLEEYIDSCEEFEEKRFVQKAVEYITDGITWENIDILLSNRILMQDSGKKRYLCMVYKEGLRIMQNGCFVRFVQDSICSLVPEKYEDKVRENITEIMNAEADKWYQKRVINVTKKYQGIDNTFQDLFSNEMKLFEEELQLLPNHKYTQDWLRYTDNSDVCILMLVGSDEFRENILSNMSSRLKIEIMDEVVQISQNYKTEHINVLRDIVKKAMQNAIDNLNKKMSE